MKAAFHKLHQAPGFSHGTVEIPALKTKKQKSSMAPELLYEETNME